MKAEKYTPSAQRALRRLGNALQIARKKRRMTVEDFAERVGVAKGTIIRLEKGDAGVSIGTLAMAFLALGELHRLEDIIDVSRDDAGLLLDQSRLPERVRNPRPPAGRSTDGDDEPGPGGFAF